MPKVTVLLPVYNGAAYITAAIQSVLDQTMDDFELLVVDDCSSDDSTAIVAGFGDPRIRVLRNEQNLGQIGSLNRGLTEARAPYVARLDQDDRCRPERLERQAAVLDAEPRVGLVGTLMDIVDDEDRPISRTRGRLDDYVDFIFAAVTNQLPLGHPSVMFRRDAVLALGGYDGSVALAEDQDLWRRLALAGYEARLLQEPLLVYRVHTGQQSQRSARLQQENNGRALDNFLATLSGRPSAPGLGLLLAWNDDFWRVCRTGADARRAAASLETLLEDAATRLDLSSKDAGKLDELMRHRVELAARRSWRTSVIRHWTASGPLLSFGLRRRRGTDLLRRRIASVFVFATAPILRVLYLVKRGALRGFGEPARFRAVKDVGRRSPRLVRLFWRLGGNR